MAERTVFRSSKEFKDAFSWDVDEIIRYLDRVTATSGRDDLRNLWTNVVELVWNSLNRNNGNLVVNHTNSGVKPWSLPTFTPTFGGIPFEVPELLSAIGIILSETTPVPSVTNQEERKRLAALGLNNRIEEGITFCLPLLAMYGKWCGTICKAANHTVWPTFVSIVYKLDASCQVQHFLLGCCIGGANQDRSGTRKVRERNLKKIAPATLSQRAPLMTDHAHIDWGHCAETYPLFLLQAAQQKDLVFGKALRVGLDEDPKAEKISDKNDAEDSDDLTEEVKPKPEFKPPPRTFEQCGGNFAEYEKEKGEGCKQVRGEPAAPIPPDDDDIGGSQQWEAGYKRKRGVQNIDHYDEAEVQKCLIIPCPNCCKIIEACNGVGSNFSTTRWE